MEENVFVYGSLNMHISGELSDTLSTMTKPNTDDDILGSQYDLLPEEAEQFYHDGYCVVPNVTNLIAIDDARLFIDQQYQKWYGISKRQDDWRTHLNLDLTDIDTNYKENGPILNVLLNSPGILGRLRDLMGEIGGIFYTQIAFRTPAPQNLRKANGPTYQIGAEYHLDGQANGAGIRFPDHWTVMVGVALVDICSTDKGNFTVFPGSHTIRSWENYPEEKMKKSLPSFEKLDKITMKKGDAIFCHVLLAHRGGVNLRESIEREVDTMIHNILTETREMIFFRIKARDLNYNTEIRSASVIQDPWVEVKSILISK